MQSWQIIVAVIFTVKGFALDMSYEQVAALSVLEIVLALVGLSYYSYNSLKKFAAETLCIRVN